MRRTILAVTLVLAAATLAPADTIYLRDGRTLRGTVLGFINGRFAVRVAPGQGTTAGRGTVSGTAVGQTQVRTGDADGEVVFFRPRDIERIEIEGRSLEEARYDTRTVEVTLGPNWIDSGVDLRRGERVQVKASGTIVAGRTRITPDGLRATDPTAPLPRAAEGVLIGAIGNDPNAPIMELGLGREFVADRDGRLYLTANRGTYTDARGSYNVQVRTERDLAPRRDAVAGSSNNRRDDEDDYGNDPFGTQPTQPAPTRPRTPAGTTADTSTVPDRTRTPRETTVNVPATSRGTDTGVDLRAGDQVTISATGQIVAGRRVGSVSPEGGRVGLGSVFAGTYPLPQAGPGALIGCIRDLNNQCQGPFFVGSSLTFTAQAEGRLILLVNDDNYGDNSGSFSVRIRY